MPTIFYNSETWFDFVIDNILHISLSIPSDVKNYYKIIEHLDKFIFIIITDKYVRTQAWRKIFIL